MTTFISTQATGVYDTVAATGAASYAWLLILIPLASAGLLLLLGRVSDKWGHLLATLASWSTFAVGAAIAAQMWNAPEDARRFGETLFTWIPAGDFTVDFGLLVDPLSITFVILVTFVGSLIHVYAIAYMEHDEARRRFFAYLNFFIAAMLTLVLADSYSRPVRRLGRRGPGVLPADRLLEPRPRERGGRQEGVRHEPCRRHGHADRHDGDGRLLPLGVLLRGLLPGCFHPHGVRDRHWYLPAGGRLR